MLAQMWGNSAFERPGIDFLSFVGGVTFHDCGYEAFDTAPIPDVEEQRWLDAQRRGAQRRLTDVEADILVKLHVKRLVSFKQTPARIACAEEIETLITARLVESSFSREQLEWCDRITHFCDNLAFDFCFEVVKSGSVTVCPRWGASEEIELTYHICEGGIVEVHPWPFSADSFSRFLIGYHLAGYPEQAEPLIVPLQIRSRS
jgi:hypothetical protein